MKTLNSVNNLWKARESKGSPRVTNPLHVKIKTLIHSLQKIAVDGFSETLRQYLVRASYFIGVVLHPTPSINKALSRLNLVAN